MKPRINEVSRAQNSKKLQGQGPNWILIAGGALLSTLFVQLQYKLKQALAAKRANNVNKIVKGNVKSTDRRLGVCSLHSNGYSCRKDDGCYNCFSECTTEFKGGSPRGPLLTEIDTSLPLVTVPAPEPHRGNGVICVASPECLNLPRKPFHHSNSSESPCVSESSSDIFSKREVVCMLRQQLKKRDEMILEMQDQIIELRRSIDAQLAHSTLLQSQLDAANGDLFASEREIQRLRKTIADHCVRDLDPHWKPVMARDWSAQGRNSHANGYREVESNFDFIGNARGDEGTLKREVGELKEAIEGKEYLLQSYKQQKAELSTNIKELQQRLASQVPDIL